MSPRPPLTPPPESPPGWRDRLDSWLPTLARYAGLVLMVYAALIDRGRNPALIPAATGLIFLKTVYGGSKD